MTDFFRDLLFGATIMLSLKFGLIALTFLLSHAVALKMIIDGEMGWKVFFILTPASLVSGGLSHAFYQAAHKIY